MRPAARISRLLSLAGVACVGLGLSGCVTVPTPHGGGAASWTGTRTISLLETDTGERLTVAYGRDGRYDSDAMQRVSQLFRDRHNGDVSDVDPHLLDVLVRVREEMGLSPDVTFVVTSGYRSPVTNASLARRSPNVAENSYHLRGQAVDFHIDGVSSERIAETAGALRLGGYAWYPHTGHVHLDTGPVRTWTPRAPRRGGGWVEVRSTSRRSSMAVAAVPSKAETSKAGKTTLAKAALASKPSRNASKAAKSSVTVARHSTSKNSGAKVIKVASAPRKPSASAKSNKSVVVATRLPSRPPSR